MLLDNCKLTYFGITGRGEATRLALAIGNVKFTDDRVSFADWKEFKPTTPWGSLPILTLSDGTVIAQQRAILRFVGTQTNLYPSDVPIMAAKIDEILDAAEDIGAQTMKAGQGLEQAEKEEARKVACSEGGAVYNILSKLDALIAKNANNGITVGDTLSIADIFVYCIINNLVGGFYDGVPTDTLDSFGNLTALRKIVRSNPGVCKFYDDLDSSIQMPKSYGKL